MIEAPPSVAIEFHADKAGFNVLFVPNEEPYHQRKVTLLNVPHTVLAPVPFLSGINLVRDACRYVILGKYIRKVIFDELLETIDFPRNELIDFGNEVLERFSNPFVDHSVVSIMLNSFSKYKTCNLPSLKKFLC